MIPKYFKLGGMDYQVKLTEVIGYRWRVFLPLKEIHLAPEYEGERLRDSVLIKHFWEAITCLLVDKVMSREKPHWIKYRSAYGHLIAQLMMQLTPDWCNAGMNIEYGIQVGGTNLLIRFDNKECERRKIYGQHDYNNGIILLSYEGISDGQFMQYSQDFITRVLIHECLHAVANEMDLEKSKWNGENHVNTMAFFLTEILLTLKNEEVKERKLVSEKMLKTFAD